MEVKNMRVRELDREQDNEMGSVGAYFYACVYRIYLLHPRLPINFRRPRLAFVGSVLPIASSVSHCWHFRYVRFSNFDRGRKTLFYHY